jgi:hypothetical protein
MDRRFIATIAAVAAIALGSSAYAQQAPTPQPSDTELQQFADIYVDLQETAGKYEPQIANARTEQEAVDVRAKLQEESMATVTKHGWNADRYNTVARAVNADPELAEKLIALIEERLPPTEQ